MVESRSEHVVLLSGGVDSAVILAMLADRKANARAVWVDYNQAAVEAEEAASRAIAEYFDVPWSRRTVGGAGEHGPGEITGRNDMLVAVASLGQGDGVIAIGIHAGTGYEDCSPGWLSAWQQLKDLQLGGTQPVSAPLIDLSKSQVYDLASSLHVPFGLTHSCEAANSPCWSCRSCLDRKAFGVLA